MNQRLLQLTQHVNPVSMKQVMLLVLYVSSMSILPGCNGDGSGEGVATAVEAGTVKEKHPASSADVLFGKEITSKPCDILPPDEFAGVAGVDPSALEQRAMASMCLYSWEGGQASVGLLRVSKTVEAARARFEKSYRNQTREDVAQSMTEINAQIKKQVDKGETEVDPQNAKVVTGAMSDLFSGGMQYEDIPGLGEIARFEVTRTETQYGDQTFVSYANTLNVLTGNLKFTVSFSRDGEPKLYRDENVALAEAVLRKLSN